MGQPARLGGFCLTIHLCVYVIGQTVSTDTQTVHVVYIMLRNVFNIRYTCTLGSVWLLLYRAYNLAAKMKQKTNASLLFFLLT